MDPISGKKAPANRPPVTESAPSPSDGEEEFFDAVERHQPSETTEINAADNPSSVLSTLSPRATSRPSTSAQPLLPPAIAQASQKKPYRKYFDEEVLQELDRVGLADLIKQPSNDLEFLSAERLLQEMAVLDKSRPSISSGDTTRLTAPSGSVGVLSATQGVPKTLTQTWIKQGLDKILGSSDAEQNGPLARSIIEDVDGFEDAVRTRLGATKLFMASLPAARATGVFPTSFQPGTPSESKLRKGETHDVSGDRVYTMWRDHAGVLRTHVPLTGTDSGKEISRIKADEQGFGRRVFRALSMNRTVKFPFMPVTSKSQKGKARTHVGMVYNAHFAPLGPETYNALALYTEKDYERFEDAVLQHDSVTKDILDTFRDGPIFSETMIKSILRKTAEQNCKAASDGFFTYKRAAKAFCHYLRNISVRKSKSALHPAHGLWENTPVYTNRAYVALAEGRNAEHGLQKTIDSILFEGSSGSLIDNIYGAAIRSAIIVAGMHLCAKMTDFENRQHMDNVAQTVGTICSLISGALSAAPLVTAGAVAGGILDPLKTAIISHKASRFEEGRMQDAIRKEIHASLLAPANSGMRVPGLKEVKAGRPPLSMAERARIGEFFVTQYNEMFNGI